MGGMGGMGGMGPGQMLPEGTALSGMVKSFDPIKGYGFIIVQSFPQDVYFKADGDQIVKGCQVTFTLKYSKDGKPQGENVSLPPQAGDTLAGKVKRYNPQKGFGFLMVDGQAQDFYFQKKDMPPEFQDQFLDGAEVQFVVRLTSDGKPQAQDIMVLAMPDQVGEKRSAGEFESLENAAKRQRIEPSGGGGGFNMSGAGFMQESFMQVSPAGGSAGAGGRHTGQVKSYNQMKGFGFIVAPTVQGDVWFRSMGLPEDLQQLGGGLPGIQVSFDLMFAADGKPQGANLQIAA